MLRTMRITTSEPKVLLINFCINLEFTDSVFLEHSGFCISWLYFGGYLIICSCTFLPFLFSKFLFISKIKQNLVIGLLYRYIGCFD